MASRDPRVDAYIKKAAPFAQPILMHIREVVHAACPETQETLKWGTPHFDYKGQMMCGMAAFKRHCVFGFWKGQLLAEQGLLSASTESMAGYSRIEKLEALPPDRTLHKLIKAAMGLNDKGIPAPRAKKAPKPPPKPPADLVAALKGNKKAQAAFTAFSASHKREYIEWITEAKTEATRQKRLAQAIEWIAEGKGRNWKYQ
jgi:uncharacterized protein YdeI (YjbR/CyaY-like superfamily)